MIAPDQTIRTDLTKTFGGGSSGFKSPFLKEEYMRHTKWFFPVIGLTAIILLSSCKSANDTANRSTDSGASAGSTEEISVLQTEGISDEFLAEYQEKHNTSVAVIDVLIPQQALLVGDESFVKLIVLEGITGETVILRDSVARIEKTEIPGVGMVTVKIVDRTGKEISVTLTPEDAEKISE